MRTAQIERKTKETEIQIGLNLDGGTVDVKTGIGFFDHMLEAFAVHAGIGLQIETKGDLHVDGHHTVEDTGIALGQAFAKALGSKEGMRRYGSSYIPMDESLAFTAIDLSGRPFLVFDAAFSDNLVGTFESCLCEEFFRAFAFNARATLHMKLLYGGNTHHKIEALFKAAAHAVAEALQTDESRGILSTKGVLEI